MDNNIPDTHSLNTFYFYKDVVFLIPAVRTSQKEGKMKDPVEDPVNWTTKISVINYKINNKKEETKTKEDILKRDLVNPLKT